MRKNRTMRVAALLLALTLITSCFVGGTFAKYITESDATASGRVAHWGFNAADNDAAFLKLFDANEADSITRLDADETTYLIAPGSNGSATFSFVTADSATNPEVAYEVKVDLTGTTATISTELENAMNFYFDDASKTTPLTWVELQNTIKALSGEGDKASADGTVEYEAGANVPDGIANGASHTVSWDWAYENRDDAEDTELGNKALAELEKLTLAIKVTVKQLDTI